LHGPHTEGKRVLQEKEKTWTNVKDFTLIQNTKGVGESDGMIFCARNRFQ
jgi:hypothetical protein